MIKEPPKAFRPMARWWWPGLDVEAAELEREVAELDDAGFGGAEVQAFLIGSPSPDPARKHRFAPNPYYYEMLRVVLEAARSRGMTVDITVSSSWPPGGSWVSEADALKTLLVGTTMLKGPSRIQVRVPPFKLNPFYKHQRLIGKVMGSITTPFDPSKFTPLATVAVKPIQKSTKVHFIKPKATLLDRSSAIDVSTSVDEYKYLEWQVPEGELQLFTIYQGPSGMTPMSDARPAPGVPSRVVDMFDAGAVERFVNGHFDPGDELLRPYYGSTLRAVFTDSQEIASEWFWTPDFFDQFQARRGYDVRPYLPACFVPNRDNQFLNVIFQNETPCFEFPGGEGARIRHDWEETLSDLFAERYCGGVSKLVKERGNMLHRIQTYGIRVDLLKAFGRADIPETEMLFAGGAMDFLKLASSAALVYKKPVASAEAFVWMRRDYMTTPLKLKVAVDKLIVAGINQVIYHGYPYDAPWKGFPGHYPWSPPCFSDNFNRHNAFWPCLPAINAYIARAQVIMRRGKTRCNVGVYYDMWNYDYKHLKQEDLTGGHLPGFDAPPENDIIHAFMRSVKNRTNRLTLRRQLVGDAIMARGYTYTHVNEEALLDARIEAGKMMAGDAALEAIVFPWCEKISQPLAWKLLAAARSGVKVIFHGIVPDGQPGFLHHEERDPEIRAAMERAIAENTFTFLKDDDDVGLALWQDLGIVPVVDFVKREPAIQAICKDAPEGAFYFVRSTAEQPVDVEIGFHEKGVPHEVDLWTGTVRPCGRYRGALKRASTALKYGTNRQTFTLSLEPYGSRVFWFRDDVPRPLHVAEANVDVEVNGDTVTALLDASTSVRVMLGDGTVLQEACLLPPPRPASIDAWRVTIDHRNPDATRREIVVDPVAPGDWRDIKPLRYCCGPGTYETVIVAGKEHVEPGIKLYLDLGFVHDVATVTVNGHEFPPLLVPPYRVDITGQVREGENRVSVRVIASLRNLLAGYGKQAGKPWKHHARRKLMPAGLLGPVRLVARLAVPMRAAASLPRDELDDAGASPATPRDALDRIKELAGGG